MKVVIIGYLGFLALYLGLFWLTGKIVNLPKESRLRQWWHRNVVHFDDLEK